MSGVWSQFCIACLLLFSVVATTTLCASQSPARTSSPLRSTIQQVFNALQKQQNQQSEPFSPFPLQWQLDKGLYKSYIHLNFVGKGCHFNKFCFFKNNASFYTYIHTEIAHIESWQDGLMTSLIPGSDNTLPFLTPTCLWPPLSPRPSWRRTPWAWSMSMTAQILCKKLSPPWPPSKTRTGMKSFQCTSSGHKQESMTHGKSFIIIIITINITVLTLFHLIPRPGVPYQSTWSILLNILVLQLATQFFSILIVLLFNGERFAASLPCM